MKAIQTLLMFLSACSPQSDEPPKMRSVLAEDVITSIDDCHGFANNWPTWLEEVQHRGWWLIDEYLIEYGHTAVLRSEFGFMTTIGQKNPKGWIGKNGRCEVNFPRINDASLKEMKAVVKSKFHDKKIIEFKNDLQIKISENETLYFAAGAKNTNGEYLIFNIWIEYSDLKFDASVIKDKI